VTNSVILDQIGVYTYKAILEIQQQHPEWLKAKYRQVAWQDARHESMFKQRLQQELSSATDIRSQLIKLRKFLQMLLENNFFESAEFKVYTAKVRHLLEGSPNHQPNEAENHQGAIARSTAAKPIAILLLDAENLHLTAELEKFLQQICTYPIQIKIAFANWRSMGKRDVELHERQYELIHVPPGKDSADLKMASVGSSIFVHYPTAKEVLVCSSDNALSHLCTTLQTHGLTVYRVRKQGDNLAVFNSKTGATQTHSLKPPPEIPTVEQFINQLKQLIKTEQKRTGIQWIKLSRVSNLFQTKHNLTISQVTAIHFPGKKSRDIFGTFTSDFVIHQPDEQAQLYVTLFEVLSDNSENNGADLPPGIKSSTDFEEALIDLINELTNKSPGSYISISIVGTQFQKKYGKPISQMLKKLHLTGNLPKFMQNCDSLKLQQREKGWEVAIAEPAR
jgi:hypothetical protein